ncbi:MAG: DUF11 domain-containing protein, partial [Micrococcales bacterium]|nr:DUF11 domain-containing protein [Micrococcales bacterium]
FTLTNLGPSTARDVEFRVHSVADLGVNTPARCVLAGGEFVCRIENIDLAPGASVTETFPLVVYGYVAPGAYPVTVSTSTITPETTLVNNVAEEGLVVGSPRNALQATKAAFETAPNPADGHDAYTAGTPFRYQIEVTSPDALAAFPAPYGADAKDVLVTDTLPTGFTATSAVSTVGTCTISPDGTQVECDLGTVPSYMPSKAAPVTITVIGLVDADAPTGTAGEQVDNTAVVTSSTPNLAGNPTSLRPSAVVDVIAEADLRLIKVADDTVVYAGGKTSFTLTVVNAGPSVATDVTVIDTLPVYFDLVAADSPGCQTISGTPATGVTVECALGDVGLSESVPVRIFASLDYWGGRAPGCHPGAPCDPVYPMTVTNSATVTSSSFDPDLGNNDASADVEAARLADHAIIGSVSTDTPSAGGMVVYNAISVNNGPSVADDAYGVSTFPPGFVPMEQNPTGVPGNECTWDPPAPANPQTVPWSNTQYTLSCHGFDVPPWFIVFEPGIPLASQVSMWIPADTPPGEYTTEVMVGTTTPESNTENNTAVIPVNVQQVSDLSVTKTLVDPMLAGRDATWRVVVTNNGPSVADNVMVTDYMPDQMSFVSAQVEGGAQCVMPTSTDETAVSCPVGVLGVGQSAVVVVTFAVPLNAAGTEQCNAVLVGSASLDPDASNNQAKVCSVPDLPPAADLAVTITTSTPDVAVGDQAQFLAQVANNGPGDGTSVVVTFDVPNGLTNVTGVVLGADGAVVAMDCTGRLVCTIDSIVPGGKVVYRIVGTVSSAAGKTLTLRATVTHGEPDPVAANDTASVTVDLVGSPTSPPPGVTPPDATPPPDRVPSNNMPITGTSVVVVFALAFVVLASGVWWLMVARRARR